MGRGEIRTAHLVRGHFLLLRVDETGRVHMKRDPCPQLPMGVFLRVGWAIYYPHAREMTTDVVTSGKMACSIFTRSALVEC